MKTNNNKVTRFIITCISIYFNLFLCISIYSQSDSLFNYLEIAAKNNPLVMQRYYEYMASLQKVPQVGSLPDPEISLGVFLKPMELMDGKQLADIRLMQMFPWFGVLKSARDEMSLMAKAKFESFQDARLQLYYDVQRTWYEMHKVKQNLRISGKNIEILRTIERLAVARFKSASAGRGSASDKPLTPSSGQSSSSGSSGMQTMGGNQGNTNSSSDNQNNTPMPGSSMGSLSGGSGLSDVYRIQIEMGELQNNIELLSNRWNTLSAEFNSYLNRPPTSPVNLPDTLVRVVPNPSIFALSDSGLVKNPMLGMIKYEQQSLNARYKMVSRMGYPMIGLGVNYSLIKKSEMNTSPMNGKDMIMPMVTATLPVYRKKYKAMQAEVTILHSASEQNYKATSNTLQTDYYQAIQLFQDAQRRIKLYADQNQLAAKSLDIMLRSFTSEGSDLSDIFRVQQQNLNYEYKQMEAVADYNTAIAWLNRIVGL
ncbi:MAG: TolC family protein [Bacteroidetes bacterium]|nr:TolC family protein [Bacteroidota bacterium]